MIYKDTQIIDVECRVDTYILYIIYRFDQEVSIHINDIFPNKIITKELDGLIVSEIIHHPYGNGLSFPRSTHENEKTP